jgi:hypothetical protein
LKAELAGAYPGFAYQAVKANTSAGKDEVEMSEELAGVLRGANEWDLEVLAQNDQKQK